jgi:hypothetical protein
MNTLMRLSSFACLAGVTLALSHSGFAESVEPSPDLRAQIDQAVEAVYPALVRIHVVSESGRDGRMM